MKKHLTLLTLLVLAACSSEPTDNKQMGTYIFDRHIGKAELQETLTVKEGSEEIYVPASKVRCAFTELAPRLFSETELNYMYTTNALTAEMRAELSDALAKSIQRARKMPAHHCN